jgi:PAS domain S-box-containing protein
MGDKRKPLTRRIPKQRQGGLDFPAESRLWERVFNTVPDLIAVLDRRHRIVRVNQPMAEKLRRTPEQCVGLKCCECVHGTRQPPSYCPHSRALADGQSHTMEVHDEHFGGDYLVSVSPLRDESGRMIGSVHVARNITELKRAQEMLRHLLKVSEHERQLIGCEIHDGLSQQLTAALMQFEAFGKIKYVLEQAVGALDSGVQLIRDARAESRRLIQGLRPRQLANNGVLKAIDKLVKELSQRNKLKIEFSAKVTTLDLAPVLEDSVFRIVQECVANACRHSKSKKVKVELAQRGGLLRIVVRDWGVGFDVNQVQTGHFGLEGIRFRAQALDGRATVQSQPGKGTEVRVELPLHPDTVLET